MKVFISLLLFFLMISCHYEPMDNNHLKLWDVIVKGEIEEADSLIKEKNLDVKKLVKTNNWTILMEVITKETLEEEKYLKTIEFLVKKGADVNAIQYDFPGFDGFLSRFFAQDTISVLMYAVIAQKPEIIKILIENGVGINWKSKRNNTAISRVPFLREENQQNSIEIAILLINAGADVCHKYQDGTSIYDNILKSNIVSLIDVVKPKGIKCPTVE